MALFNLSVLYSWFFTKCDKLFTSPAQILKGHSQLMHMRVKYHFLADFLYKTYVKQKRIRNTLNKPCGVELVTSWNLSHIRTLIFDIPLRIHQWIFPGKPNIDEYFPIRTSVEVRNCIKSEWLYCVEGSWSRTLDFSNICNLFHPFSK